MDKKALIAMSGGVDSSVSAYLMQKQGFDCTGATMKLFQNEDIGLESEKSCCSLSDAEDARSIAYSLGMPFYVFNFSDDFKQQVIERFIRVYQEGHTPNPCIDCNRFMKFEKLFQRAKLLNMDYIVTGHYARIQYDTEKHRWLLKKAVDSTKDQSYVLYSMTQEQLAHTQFPLGELCKSEVRKIADQQGFINARKRDSQDICFVPGGKYAEFIESYTGIPAEGGDFLDIQGNPLGKHKGLIRYTVGQRRGLGLALPQPLYVHSKDLGRNTVTLCEDKDLFLRSFTVGDFNWISVQEPSEPLRIKAKVRYTQQEQWATAVAAADGTVQVQFDQPQRAISKGQAAVLYDGDTVVGGGIIISVEQDSLYTKSRS